MNNVSEDMTATGQGENALNVMTISKADRWVDELLPRFAAYVDANCTGVVHRHLLLIDEPGLSANRRSEMLDQLQQRWHSVVLRPPLDEQPGQRLLTFDALRAGLLTAFGLSEGLYLDPDTDVVGDLHGLPRLAPEAGLLWVANPLPLDPVLADLRRHGFTPSVENGTAVTLEPGFLYLRQDFSDAFADLQRRYPDLHPFAPGSTYWNMLMLTLGPRAVRLPDEFNRTFWDVPAATRNARTVHFTGQWKRLQPYVSYDRANGRIGLSSQPAALPAPRRSTSSASLPRKLSVVAILRDCEDYLPTALSRFAAWEKQGLAIRYTFLENDSVDATPALLKAFMAGRQGQLECKQLAAPYDRTRASQAFGRIMPLARMRNHALSMARSVASANEEWTLLFDADIYFPDDVLTRVFETLATDSAPDTIGMVSVYTQQLFRADQVPRIGEPVDGWPGWSAVGHYYDTFAFRDQFHRSHRPFCGFARCRSCSAGRSAGYPLPLVPADQSIVDVTAAYGGFALLPSRIVSDPRLNWSTYSGDLPEARSLCEHVIFCDRLRTLTGKRVVVLQAIDDVYRAEGGSNAPR